MKLRKRKIGPGIALFLLVINLIMTCMLMAAEQEYREILQAIALDIAGLKAQFPQLKTFSPAACADLERLAISYSYSTHQPQHRAGWTAGVPNPNPDGVWFYIDFHDRNSMAQIHTQPATVPLCHGDKRVSFLILEGKKTKSVGNRIRTILEKNGVKQCEH